MIDDITKAGVAGRSRVDQLLPLHVEAARQAASAIAHPWYRCQALSAVARATADPESAQELLLLALDAAREQKEPNRIVTVSSWPLSVLVTLNLELTKSQLASLLAIIDTEPNPIRRADGLLMVVSAIHTVANLRDSVVMPLLDAIKQSRGWKASRILALLALLIAVYDRRTALEILGEGRETRHIRQARRMIEAGENLRAPFRLPGHTPKGTPEARTLS